MIYRILSALFIASICTTASYAKNNKRYCQNEIANLIVIEIKKKQPILKEWIPSEKSCQAILDVSVEITTQLLQKGQFIEIEKMLTK